MERLNYSKFNRFKRQPTAIVIRVNTIWNGRVAVRDRYTKQAVAEKLDIQVWHEREVMLIPYDKIQDLKVGISERPMKDKFSEEYHFLIYFDWKPTKPKKISLEELSRMGVFG